MANMAGGDDLSRDERDQQVGLAFALIDASLARLAGTPRETVNEDLEAAFGALDAVVTRVEVPADVPVAAVRTNVDTSALVSATLYVVEGMAGLVGELSPIGMNATQVLTSLRQATSNVHGQLGQSPPPE